MGEMVLPAEMTDELQRMDSEIRQLREIIRKGKDAGLDMAAAEAKLENADRVRKGMLKNFAAGLATRSRNR